MSASSQYRRIQGLLAVCTLFASCLLSWGDYDSGYAGRSIAASVSGDASGQPKVSGMTAAPCMESLQPQRYPALIFDVEASDNKRYDWTVSLDTGEKSDSPIWMDIVDIVKKGKLWRMSVFKLSDGRLVDFSDWKSVTNPLDRNLTLSLPLEVLLRADFDVCNSETPKVCKGDDPTSVNVAHDGGSFVFLLHKYPE